MVMGKQPSPNVSTIDFARQVFNEAETGRSFTQGSIPGDTGRRGLSDTPWSLTKTQMPPDRLLWVAIDAYFSRVHWFTLIFHEIRFRDTAKRVLALSTWKRRDLSDVIAVLTVVAVGLKAALPDSSWAGYEILHDINLDGCQFMISLVSEIRLHLLDLIEDCRIEAVQVCLLLSSIYGYHDSPSFAWNTAGMAFRAAIYLELYKMAPGNEDPITTQVRCRCWNTAITVDAANSILYGRPLSIDTAFARLHVIHDSEDMRIHPSLLSLPVFKEVGDTVSRASFHMVKFSLYSVVRKALARSMHLRSSGGNEEDRLEAIAQAACDSEALLRQWHMGIPSLFDFTKWTQGCRLKQLENSLQGLQLDIREEGEVIILQAAILQVIYDSSLILVHQPLLEYKMHSVTPSTSIIDSLNKSFGVAVQAALRISHAPVHLFQWHFAISFISLQLFTAGVILCLVPPNQPFTHAAQEAKSGVLRIIKACQAVQNKDRITQQTVELLADLLKVTVNREMASALKVPGESPESNHIPTGRVDQAGHDEPQYPTTTTTANWPTNAQADILSPIPFTTEQNPSTPGYLNLSGETDPAAFMNESASNSTGLESFLPTLPQPAQMLQQFDDTFGAYGQCKSLYKYNL